MYTQKFSLSLVKEGSVKFDNIKIETNTIATNVAVACGHMNKPNEEFWAIALDIKMRPIGYFKAGQGTINTTIVDIPGVMKFMLLVNGVGLIITHNHPSGMTTPSDNDIILTKKIKNACELLDMRLVDHIIISHEDDAYSFAAHEKL